MYRIKIKHCPDCGKQIRYNGVWIAALVVHYRIRHWPWMPLPRDSTHIKRSAKEIY